MFIDQLHVPFVFIDGQFMRIILQQYAFVRAQACYMAVNRFSLTAILVVEICAFLVIVSYSYLLVFPDCSICQHHRYFSGYLSPFLRIRIDSRYIRGYQTFQEGVFIIQSQHDMTAAFSADIPGNLYRTGRRSSFHLILIIQLCIDEYRAACISSQGCDICSSDCSSSNRYFCSVRLNSSPHLGVNIHKSFNVYERTSIMFLRFNSTEIFSRVFYTDFYCMCRIIIIFYD